MNTAETYLAYGTLIKCNIDLGRHLLPGDEGLHQVVLHPVDGAGSFTGLDHYTSFLTSHGRELSMISDRPFGPSAARQAWQFEVKGVVTFQWVSGKPDIGYELGADGNEDLLAFWLIHIFLPIYLSLEANYDFIHAGAIDVDGRTIMFIAPSMGGKSTLTEYFVRQGHALVSDDKVATFIEDGRFIAVPSHANYRPYRRFEDLGYQAGDFQPVPQPIQSFYLLERDAEVSGIEISEVKGYRKFDHLLPNYLFSFSHLKAKRLEYLAQMVNSVPVFSVRLPDDIDRLEEVYAAICSHCSNFTGLD